MGMQVMDNTDVIEKKEEVLDDPGMYRVIMYNDDYTTMEFVVSVLVNVFKNTVEQATKIMLNIHQNGQATVGIYTYDIAYTRVKQVYTLAERFDFPLKCSIISSS